MNTEKYENETLKFFAGKEGQFPMISQCIQTEAPIEQAANQAGSNSTPTMKVIWAGPKDKQYAHVICELTASDGAIANSCFARVVDKNGKQIAEESFVSFSRSTAFAILPVPRDIFAECSVYMEMASIGSFARISSDEVSLEEFDVGEKEVAYDITAPVITRSKTDDRIKISYWEYSSKSSYDYVYPGRHENQMYFPTSGKITIKDIELERASMALEISDGIRTVTYPNEPTIKVEDDTITYSIEEKWSGTKLDECFDYKKEVNASAYYLLTINAWETGGRHFIPITITNHNKLLKDETASTTKGIYPMEVYLDCLAEGTEISMVDGTMKLVENICKGDLVKTKDGGQSPIKEVSIQEDCQVLNLVLESGRQLSLTDGHAVYTKDGIYPASRLKKGQEVFTENGTDIIDEIVPHCERTYKVYSLLLEDDGEWLFANGVMVYGSDSADLFKDRDWIREDLPKEWLTDYDNALKAGILYE